MVEVARKKPLIFNPDEETKEMLIASFVIRKEMFNKIFKEIKEADQSTAPQHFLLVGQRGMGKTTMLLRLKYAIADDPELADHLITVKFSEEQYQIGSLVDLWEEIMHHLENQDSAFKGLYQESIKYEKEKDYERLCFNLLTKKLKQENKRIILLIDNINNLFKKLTDIETRRLREVLMTSKHLQLIGASSSVLEHSFEYDKPFFEFFDQIKLEPIGRNETISLMKALGENYDASNKINEIIESNPQRIEALRRITGGVPRTLVLLFEIFVDSNHGAAFEDLETLTDRVTALYKERMDSLKPQQQRIMDALARAWEPITASEVLDQSKLYRENVASNQISSQLKQLEDNQLVEVIQVKGRKKSYRIRERFFNIWYLMRHGQRSVKEKVLWLVRFLETWCSPDELKQIAQNQIAGIGTGSYSQKAAYYRAVAMDSIKDFDFVAKKELLKQTEAFLLKSNHSEWANTIRLLADAIESNSYTKKAFEAMEIGEIQLAETLLLDAVRVNEPDAAFNIGSFYSTIVENKKKAEEFFLKASEQNNLGAIFNLGNFYRASGKFEEAEQFYTRAANLGHLKAAANLGSLYFDRNDFEKAEYWYLKASDQEDSRATFNLALLYSLQGNLEKAERFYIKASELHNSDAMLNLGLIYHQKGELKNAEKYWLWASNFGNSKATANLGLFYEKLEELDKAEEFYHKAFKLGEIRALLNLAGIYQEKGNQQKAIELYQIASERGDPNAMFNLALLHEKNNELDKAEHFYLMASEAKSPDAMNNLAMLYLTGATNLDKAEELLLEAIKLGHNHAAYNLPVVYAARNEYIKAENYCKALLEENENNFRALAAYIPLLLRTERGSQAIDLAKKLFSIEMFFQEQSLPLSTVLALLIRGQYYFLLEEYRKENSLLAKYLAPIYYVIAWFLKDEIPGEYEKAGDEIKQSVDEIIAFVTASIQNNNSK